MAASDGVSSLFVIQTSVTRRPQGSWVYRPVWIAAPRPYMPLGGLSRAVTSTRSSTDLFADRRYPGPRFQPATRRCGAHAARATPRISKERPCANDGGGPNGIRTLALRGVVDRLLTVLMAMLAAQTTYDPARRSAMLALAP